MSNTWSTPFEGSGNISVEKNGNGHYAITQGGMPVAESDNPDEIIAGLVDILGKVIEASHSRILQLEAVVDAEKNKDKLLTGGHFAGSN